LALAAATSSAGRGSATNVGVSRARITARVWVPKTRPGAVTCGFAGGE
jgi:hypothetical protein